MNWTLTWKLKEQGNSEPQPIDGSVFRPDTLCALPESALREQTLSIGRISQRFDELFDFEGDSDGNIQGGNELVLRQLPKLDRLGAGMESGTLIIEGDAGDELGASMSGGLIVVKGNVGDRTGGPDFGASRGMTGGEIMIAGNAGNHVGHLMRRGSIAVNGSCGKSPGYRMLAGTIVVGKTPADYPGLEMQRGTIICTDSQPSEMPDAIRGEHLLLAGDYSSSAAVGIKLVLRRVQSLQKRFGIAASECNLLDPSTIQLWHGDRFELGKGEVIQCLS